MFGCCHSFPASFQKGYVNRAKVRRQLYHQPDRPIDAMPLKGGLPKYALVLIIYGVGAIAVRAS